MNPTKNIIVLRSKD